MIRVLVVDDHPVVREGLVNVLEDEPDMEVVGAVGSAEEAVARAGEARPDLVLLDLELPEMDGAEVIPELSAGVRGSRVLVFTAYETDERVFRALRAGARGYLLKGASGEEIVNAIRTVHAGGSHLEAGVAARVLEDLGREAEEARPSLTEREEEVLQLLVEGRLNKQIASALGISERTVKFHVHSICEKLGARNRTEAASLAVRQQLV